MHVPAHRPVRGPFRAWLGGRRRWREGEAGQSLVEFSLVLPIFLILLFAIVDFGRGFYSYMVVTNAAREGARAVAVQSDAATVDSKLYGSFCPSYPTTSDCALPFASITRTVTGVQGAKGTEGKVTVNYAFSFVTPIGPLLSLFGSILSAPSISSTASMRLE